MIFFFPTPSSDVNRVGVVVVVVVDVVIRKRFLSKSMLQKVLLHVGLIITAAPFERNKIDSWASWKGLLLAAAVVRYKSKLLPFRRPLMAPGSRLISMRPGPTPVSDPLLFPFFAPAPAAWWTNRRFNPLTPHAPDASSFPLAVPLRKWPPPWCRRCVSPPSKTMTSNQVAPSCPSNSALPSL